MKWRNKTIFAISLLAACAGDAAESLFFDFGEVRDTTRPVVSAILKNTTGDTFNVTGVVRTCVCADVTVSPTCVPPGASAVVTVTFDPNVFAGPFLKSYYILTDSPVSPRISALFAGSVTRCWTVLPDKRIVAKSGEDCVVWNISASRGAPPISHAEIIGAPGALFSMTTNSPGVFTARLTFPKEMPPGHHNWTVRLFPEIGSGAPLLIHAGLDAGEIWQARPRVLNAAVCDRAFYAEILLKPESGASELSDIDVSGISMSPEWDGVSFKIAGRVTEHGIPVSLRVSPEMLLGWIADKTFTFSIPGRGTASVRLHLLRGENTGRTWD